MNREKLLRRLGDRAFRRAFADEAVDVGIPIQIREMRKAREWTQKHLGEEAGVAQEAVARAENLSYGRFNLSTLKNLAAAFDCALIVRFAPFSELLAWKDGIDTATIIPPDYATDAPLHSAQERETENRIAAELTPPVASNVADFDAYLLQLVTRPRRPPRRASLLEGQYGTNSGSQGRSGLLYPNGTNKPAAQGGRS